MSKKSTLAVIGEDAPRAVVDSLEKNGFTVVLLDRDPRLPFPVSSHADMLLFCVDDKIFLTKEYASASPKLIGLLEEYGYDIILSKSIPDNFYPKDILFNVAIIGTNAIGNMQFSDETVKDCLLNNGYSLNNVKQGYAKCSTAVIGDNAIITADSTIEAAAQAIGIDVLKTTNSSAIKLDGYNYGFIGGTCGYFNGTLYFCGDISLHPEHQAIADFAQKHSTLLCSLTDDRLYDVGSIFFLEYLKG